MATQLQFEKALVETLSEREFEVSRKDAQEILEAIHDTAFKFLKKEPNQPITIRGIGRFRIRHNKARMGRNPRTGEKLRIKASKKLVLKPTKEFANKLKVKT